MSNATAIKPFDDQDLRAAEQRLAAALMADDPTAWVFEYTEDAVFDAGGTHVVEGRAALLDMAREMDPLRDVSIKPLRTEGHGHLATVWTEASWASGAGADESTVHARGMLLWRLEPDGQWRVALEHLGSAG